MAALERALNRVEWPNTPAGYECAARLAARLLEVRNRLPQALRRDALGRFAVRETE